MSGFREIPDPSYEYEVAQLVEAYKRAINEIQRELERLNLTDISRANAQATLAEIASILAALDEESAAWVALHIPMAVRNGAARTLVALGPASNIEQAQKIVKFNRLNRELVAANVADTQADLLAVTQNINRRVRAAVRSATAESMRANMAKGITGRRTISRDILSGIRGRLADTADQAIIDAAGRRWKTEVYVDMLTRTKLANTTVEATRNEAVEREAYYGVISSHGAKDACRYHEGRIIKLIPEAPGPYPTYEQLRATGQIFHCNCRHTVSPFRKIENLPARVREKAEKQQVIGNKAISTGKRNPSQEEIDEQTTEV